MSESYGYAGIGVELGQALIRLLQKKTFDKVSVKDICDEASVNRTTFYNYFDNKKQLLEATMFASTEVFIGEFQKFVDEKKDRGEAILPEQYLFHDEVLHHYLELLKKHREVFRVFAMNQGLFYSREQYADMIDFIVMPMLKKYGISDVRFAEYMTTFYVGAMHSVVLTWLRHDCEDDIDYMVRIIRTCFHIPDQLFETP